MFANFLVLFYLVLYLSLLLCSKYCYYLFDYGVLTIEFWKARGLGEFSFLQLHCVNSWFNSAKPFDTNSPLTSAFMNSCLYFSSNNNAVT